MNPLLRKPTTLPDEEATNRYAPMGLIGNPFPDDPALQPLSDNIRCNGTIYNPDLHAQQRQAFTRLLIPSAERRRAQSLAFLMDHTTHRGRGIGKSAFLKHLCDDVMVDFGDGLSGGSEVVLAARVAPEPAKVRKVWQLARAIVLQLCDDGVIAQAIARLRAFSGEIPEDVIAQVGPTDGLEVTIGCDEWLRQRGVEALWGLNHTTRRALAQAGVADDRVEILTTAGTSRDELRRRLEREFTDHWWRQDGGSLLFHDLVKVFRAAGFSRGLLLLDEAEKIIAEQSQTERRALADSLRYYLFDGQCDNARWRFFGMLLTIHPLLQEMLLPHWRAAGLDRLAPVAEPHTQQCTIYMGPLQGPEAVGLVSVYLDHFRAPGCPPGQIEPFTRDALVTALEGGGKVPGPTLRLLHYVVEEAASSGLARIDASLVHAVLNAPQRVGADAVDDTRTLPTPRVRLHDEEGR